jgi:hypothetical protein
LYSHSRASIAGFSPQGAPSRNQYPASNRDGGRSVIAHGFSPTTLAPSPPREAVLAVGAQPTHRPMAPYFRTSMPPSIHAVRTSLSGIRPAMRMHTPYCDGAATARADGDRRNWPAPPPAQRRARGGGDDRPPSPAFARPRSGPALRMLVTRCPFPPRFECIPLMVTAPTDCDRCNWPAPLPAGPRARGGGDDPPPPLGPDSPLRMPGTRCPFRLRFADPSAQDSPLDCSGNRRPLDLADFARPLDAGASSRLVSAS